MKWVALNAFKDNYIWLMSDETGAWVVDPGEAGPVMRYLEEHKLALSGILLTHHHPDHSGGIEELVQRYPGIPVYGSHVSKVSAVISHPVKEGDVIHCGKAVFNVLEIPGHTLDHVAYADETSLFCGDTLFSAGCGRVFEGTFPQMYASLQKLSRLPSETRVYCGHEYTLANLQFAEKVEPLNKFIAMRMQAVTKLMAEGKPTLPSLMSDEWQMNPFLRCDEIGVIESLHIQGKTDSRDPVEIFKVLREWKNQS